MREEFDGALSLRFLRLKIGGKTRLLELKNSLKSKYLNKFGKFLKIYYELQIFEMKFLKFEGCATLLIFDKIFD